MKKRKNPLLWLVCNWEEVVTAISVAVMLVVCIVTVLARKVLNYGIPWGTEVCNFCLVYTTFVGGAAAYKRNQHFGMDFLTDHMGPKLRYAVKLGMYALQIGLFGMLCWLSLKYTLASRKTMSISRIPYKWLDLAAVLGFASMTVYSVIFFVTGIFDRETFKKRFVTSQAQALAEAEKEDKA